MAQEEEEEEEEEEDKEDIERNKPHYLRLTPTLEKKGPNKNEDLFEEYRSSSIREEEEEEDFDEMPTDDDEGKKVGAHEDFARLHRDNDAKALLLKEKCEEISALNKHVEQHARATKRAEEARAKEREEAERWKREEKKMKVRVVVVVGERFVSFRFVSFRMWFVSFASLLFKNRIVIVVVEYKSSSRVASFSSTSR